MQTATAVGERSDRSDRAGTENEVFEATVLLSELRGFSQQLQTITERYGVSWLNGLLTQMT